MGTKHVVPRAEGQGGIGTAALGWGELFITNTTNDSATQGGKLTLTSNDGDAMQSGSRLGVIEFKGAESDSALTIGARIEAICDAAWTATENGASLKFYTTDANASESLVLTLDSNKLAVFSGAVAINGNLTVNGTTTTVNSTIVTIDDPVFTLGGDTAPVSETTQDKGIEFRYHTGSAAKIGFFGWDDSASAFTFIADATNNSEVFSGSAGDAIFGNLNLGGTLTLPSQTANRFFVAPNGSNGVPTFRVIAAADIPNDTIDSQHYAAGSIDNEHLAANSVNSDNYVDLSIDTAHIGNDQVTYAKIQNVSATNIILGRDSAGAGIIEEISPASLRTMINVADGANNYSLPFTNNSSNWNTAYGWGNHASAGYLTSLGANSVDSDNYVDGSIDTAHLADSTSSSTGVTYAKMQKVTNMNRILGRISPTDLTVAQLTKSDVLTMLNVADGANNYSLPFTDNSANWNTAHGWGNHASGGYASGSVFTTFGSYGWQITDYDGVTSDKGRIYYDNGDRAFRFYSEHSGSTGAANIQLYDGSAYSELTKAKIDKLDGIAASANNYTFNGTLSGDLTWGNGYKLSNGNNSNNAEILAATTGSAGIVLKDSGGTFKMQLYGTGSQYGFLSHEWGDWDLLKTNNGELVVRVSNANRTVIHAGNYSSYALPISGGTLTGDLTLRYSSSNSDDYSALKFAAGSDDYIIKASSTRGVFGRSSYGWHLAAASAFGVYSSGWVKCFGVEGGTGNTFATGTFSAGGQISTTTANGFKIDSSTAAYITLDSGNSWSYTSLHYNGSTKWDIGCYQGGGYEIRPYGGGSNRFMYFHDGHLRLESSAAYLMGGTITSRQGARFIDVGYSGSCYIEANRTDSASSTILFGAAY